MKDDMRDTGSPSLALDENVLTGKVVALLKGIWCQVEASRESGTRYSAVFPERSGKTARRHGRTDQSTFFARPTPIGGFGRRQNVKFLSSRLASGSAGSGTKRKRLEKARKERRT
jgi:hypothetical protein